jgi:hypothetical protein
MDIRPSIVDQEFQPWFSGNPTLDEMQIRFVCKVRSQYLGIEQLGSQLFQPFFATSDKNEVIVLC